MRGSMNPSRRIILSVTKVLKVLISLSAVVNLFFAQHLPAQTVNPALQGLVSGRTYSYRRYVFDIQEFASAPERPALLAAIQQQTDLVESTPLTESTKQFLRSFTVHVSEGEGERGGGHFGKKGIFFTSLCMLFKMTACPGEISTRML